MSNSPVEVIVGVSGREDDGITWKAVNIDKVQRGLVGIGIDHHQVHDQKFFTISIVDTGIDVQDPKYVRITSPNTLVRVHFKAAIQTLNPATIYFYENPTLLAAGTPVTIYNNDRNSSVLATATVFENTTVTADGTLLQSIRAGGGDNPSGRVGGDARQDAEWILKQNEDYIVKIITDADNNQATITFQWYEE